MYSRRPAGSFGPESPDRCLGTAKLMRAKVDSWMLIGSFDPIRSDGLSRHFFSELNHNRRYIPKIQ